MTITDEKYFREHSDVIHVTAYALHDVLHALKNDNCECLVSKEDGHLVVHYCRKHSKSADDKSLVCTDGNSKVKPSISKGLDNIKQRLRSEFKRREKEQYMTFQINIREMCKDALDKLEEQESRIKEMKDAAADIGLKWHDYDAGEDA